MKRSNPLVTVQINKPTQISIHLKEPLQSKSKKSKVSQEIELIKKFSHLELLLEKLNRLELWRAQGSLSTAEPLIKKIRETSSQLENQLCKDILKSQFLNMSKMRELYPNAFTFIFKETKSPVSNQSRYYKSAYMDQLYVTACRLYYDLKLPNHSYIVYQLALLYQCVNKQGVPFISYKERIGRKFDEIKKMTAYDQVRFDDNTIAWLQSLTLDIIMQVTEKSSIMKCDAMFYIIHDLVNKE